MIRPASSTQGLANLGLMLTLVGFASLFPLLAPVLVVLYVIAYKLLRFPHFIIFLGLDLLIGLKDYIIMAGFMPTYITAVGATPATADAIVAAVPQAFAPIFGIALLGFSALEIMLVFYLLIRPQVTLYRKLKAYMKGGR